MAHCVVQTIAARAVRRCTFLLSNSGQYVWLQVDSLSVTHGVGVCQYMHVPHLHILCLPLANCRVRGRAENSLWSAN